MEKKLFIIEDDANILYGLESQFSLNEFIVQTSEGDESLEEVMEKIKEFAPNYIV